jgi:hypothetical protein
MTDDAVSKLSSVCLFFVLFGFAPRQLGSTIYMIFTGKEPFGDLESVEVEARSSTAELPDASNLPFDDVMQSCWGGRADIHQVCSSIERSMQQMQKSEQP